MIKLFFDSVQKVFRVLFLFIKVLSEVELVTSENSSEQELRFKNFRLIVKQKEVQVDYEGLLLLNPLFLAFCTENDDEELKSYREILATEDEELRAKLMAKLEQTQQCEQEKAECEKV